jgi:alpha-L-fucosidase
MKKISTLILLLLLLRPTVNLSAQQHEQANYDQKMQWWREAKFGMFIHWGPYSLYGGEYNGYRQRRGGAEWIMNRCKIPVREYRAKATTFNPVEFNAEEIVLTAKNAGMKYVIFTSKHHDGFAMFASKASKFNIVDYTPFKRDVVDELAKACRKHGLKLGLYYSQSQDWCNPGGGTARKEMKEGWPNPDSVEMDKFTEANVGGWDCLQRSRTMEEYFKEVAIPQIKELLTQYGDIAVLWFDTPHHISAETAGEITAELAKYPQIITNDRLRRPDFQGDYKTPEGRIPEVKDVEGIDWESCMNIGSSWGFKSYEKNWKTSQTLIRNLVSIAARGGNYLLNVGPSPEGKIPSEALKRLDDMGSWLKIYGEAIYGTQRSGLYPQWGECTRKDEGKQSILYLCVFDWQASGKLVLDASYKPVKAELLPSKTKLTVRREAKQIVVDIPEAAPDATASVIKLYLSEKLPPVKLVRNAQKTFEIADEQ